MKGKANDAALGTMFVATWCDETFEIPYGEIDWQASAQSSEWEPSWVSKEPTPSREPKEHECPKPGPSPREMAPEPTCAEQGSPPHMAAPRLGFDDTM